MRALQVQPTADPVLMTLDEARAHLHIGQSTIKRLVREGRIPVVVLARQKLITRRALEEFAATLETRLTTTNGSAA